VIRAGLLAALLAGPVAAAEPCPAAWDKVTAGLASFGAVGGGVRQDGDWCLVEDLVLDMDGQYLPDWHIDRLRFRGGAVGWLAGDAAAPDSLELVAEGLRLVIETGHAQTDWLLAAQARGNAIRVEASLSWDAATRVLRLEGLGIDFPGDNMVELSAEARGVDLSSTGAMQMSVASFAVTAAELKVTTHGLFEGYLLMPLGAALLPAEGDMAAAAEALRSDLVAAVATLPESSFPSASKDALLALIATLPNPAGVLTVALRAEPGIGPARLAGPLLHGMPQSVADAAQLFSGVVVDVGWSASDAQ